MWSARVIASLPLGEGEGEGEGGGWQAIDA